MGKFKGKQGPWHWQGEVLCNDAHIVGGDSWTFSAADKKLIAAAPDLLEALQRITPMYEALMRDCGLEHKEMISTSHAAIKKALGG